VDSDEHDEFGRITEDLDLRIQMVNKRRAKEKFLIEEAIAPTVWPHSDVKHWVVCWGSTLPIVQEALERLGRDDAGLLHFSQVYPLHPAAAEILSKARTRVCLEGNAGGQFARLLKAYAGVDMTHQILKYNGAAFTVEEVVRRLKEIFE
jgi:2-oxoglutarate ferredoxin oxidoreductase subunit alpha